VTISASAERSPARIRVANAEASDEAGGASAVKVFLDGKGTGQGRLAITVPPVSQALGDFAYGVLYELAGRFELIAGRHAVNLFLQYPVFPGGVLR
jgi:hypothetical protein